MKKGFTLLFAICFYLISSAQTPVSFYTYSWSDFAGDSTVHMSDFAGKKLMIVNVASECLFTPNFKPLEELDSLYSHYNFEVIGFPCNDFAGEEGNDSQIIATCHNYSVNFPIMATVVIKTADTTPIYKWAQCESLNGVSNASVSWNFNMFLIDRHGRWVKWYPETTSPLDTAITNWIIEDSAGTTGITPLSAPETLNLRSANPTASTISLQETGGGAQNLDVTLFNAEGQLIGSVYHGNVQSGQLIQYPVTNLSSGVYLIKASTDQGQKVLRFVVEH